MYLYLFILKDSSGSLKKNSDPAIFLYFSIVIISFKLLWLVGPLVGWLVSWLVGQLVGWLIGWLVNRLVGQSVGQSVGWSVS